MAKKPDRLQYGADDIPPQPGLLLLSIQHMCLALVFAIYPAAIAQKAGMTPLQKLSGWAGWMKRRLERRSWLNL